MRMAFTNSRDNTFVYVVVDSSAWGSQNPLVHLGMLRKWVAACDYTSSTLVIPEAVVWELFAHYQEAERAAREALGTYNRIRTRHDELGVELSESIDLAEFEARIRGTGARVWKMGGDVAIQSIRD
jgi:hypothetical protein